MPSLTHLSAWHARTRHHAEIASATLRQLLAADAQRFAKFSARQDDLLLDYSKNRLPAGRFQSESGSIFSDGVD